MKEAPRNVEAAWSIREGDVLDRLREMPDESVPCVITDPPYGMRYQSNRCEGGPRFAEIVGDESFSMHWADDLFRVTAAPGSWFLFCDSRKTQAVWDGCLAAGMTPRSVVVWDKGRHGMGNLRAAFGPQHESAIFATKGDWSFPSKRPTSVLSFSAVPPESLVHPAQKPLSLMRFLVRYLSWPHDLILDPFAGSGTTILAAVLQGRNSIGIELNPEYIAIAERRIKAHDPTATIELAPGVKQASLFTGDMP